MSNHLPLLALGIALLLGACQGSPGYQVQPLPPGQDLTGTAWQMDYSMEVHDDTTFRHIPEHWLRIKTFTRNRFTFTGYDLRENRIAGMGGGTYHLRDSLYTEEIEFHHEADFNGTQFQGTLYFDSLYLYQSGQVGDLVLRERWHRID